MRLDIRYMRLDQASKYMEFINRKQSEALHIKKGLTLENYTNF